MSQESPLLTHIWNDEEVELALFDVCLASGLGDARKNVHIHKLMQVVAVTAYYYAQDEIMAEIEQIVQDMRNGERHTKRKRTEISSPDPYNT